MGRSVFACGMCAVAAGFEEIVHGTAVADHNTLVVPFVSEYLHQQPVASAAGVTLVAVIGTHHLLNVGLGDKILESGQVSFPKVAQRHVFGIETVAVPFRSGVYGKMLGTGMRLVVWRIFRTLQSAHHSHAHLPRQIRVFAVGLLSAPPTRVTENVDVGCPEGEAAVNVVVPFLPCQSCLCTGFIAYCGKDIV